MYFSNMIGKGSIGLHERNRGSLPIDIRVEDNVSTAVCFLDKENKKICIDNASDVVNLFDFNNSTPGSLVTPFKGASPLKYEEVAETDINPLVVVLCRKIRFYDGVKTFIKTVLVGNDMILAMLIYGAADFMFDDGTWVPMQRCNQQNLDTKVKKEYNAEEFVKMIHPVTKGGYNKVYDIVNAVLIEMKKTLISFRIVPSECTDIDTDKLSAVAKSEKEAEEAKLRAVEEARLEKIRRQEEWEREKELRRRKAAEEEAEKARAKAMKSTRSKTYTGEADSTGEAKRNAGAAAFLAFVQGSKDPNS